MSATPNQTDRADNDALARLGAAIQVRPHPDGDHVVDLMVSAGGGMGLTPPMSEAAAVNWRRLFIESLGKVLA